MSSYASQVDQLLQQGVWKKVPYLVPSGSASTGPGFYFQHAETGEVTRDLALLLEIQDAVKAPDLPVDPSIETLDSVRQMDDLVAVFLGPPSRTDRNVKQRPHTLQSALQVDRTYREAAERIMARMEPIRSRRVGLEVELEKAQQTIAQLQSSLQAKSLQVLELTQQNETLRIARSNHTVMKPSAQVVIAENEELVRLREENKRLQARCLILERAQKERHERQFDDATTWATSAAAPDPWSRLLKSTRT